MMNQVTLSASEDALARRLREAYRSGTVPPLRDSLDPGDGAKAYRIQEINTRFWQNEGRRLVGRKIGLTARAVQAQLGVDQPDYGALFADMAIPNGGRLDPARVLQPKAEAEIALVLKADLYGADVTPEAVHAAASHAVAAIEIVDSRIADWKITFADTVADNGSSAFYVLGDQPRPLDGLDLFPCGMATEVNGAIVSVGAGAACLGHPLNAAAWLARTVPLRAGDVVLTGALGPMVALSRGDKVIAHIGGLGSVSFALGDA
jgi:2-keto-4-pentenoate hydratase